MDRSGALHLVVRCSVASLVGEGDEHPDAELTAREATLISVDTVLLSYRLKFAVDAVVGRRSGDGMAAA